MKLIIVTKYGQSFTLEDLGKFEDTFVVDKGYRRYKALDGSTVDVNMDNVALVIHKEEENK